MQPLTLRIDDRLEVPALLHLPPKARCLQVLAHGAGAGMTHPFLAAISAALAERAVGTLRFQFPYMAEGKKRPDPPKRAQAAVRAACAAAAVAAPGLPVVAGGKSFGGRMSSSAAAQAPLAGVRGLVFLGFPLHPAGKPSDARAAHLADADVPMLFLQGTRDPLADLDSIRRVTDRLGERATLHVVEGGDHSFHVLQRSGRTDAEVVDELADAIAEWLRALL